MRRRKCIYNVNNPSDICSAASQITYIYIRDKKPVQLWRKYVLGGVGGLIEQQVHYS
jgi:hypothetical protein